MQEDEAMMEGHARATALVAATTAAIAAGNRLPWEQVDEIVGGDHARETLAIAATLAALAIGLVNDGVRVGTPDVLDVMAAACTTDLFDEGI